MSRPRRVAYATGSRADYGIVRRYLGLLDADPSIDLTVLATASMLDDRFGAPVSLVESDAFAIGARVLLPLGDDGPEGVARAMAVALEGFAGVFASDRPDLLVVLGDRYEMLSVATAAAMARIPILHLHGGEATYGNYDEFIRHAITKMSLYHITSAEPYRRRVIQLGEAPERVWCLGSLGVENCLLDAAEPHDAWVESLPEDGFAVVLFHPETASGLEPRHQVEELLCALDAVPELLLVVIGPNADTGASALRQGLGVLCERRENACWCENLTPATYHALLRRGGLLVGNSSSGIIEAPSLGAWTVNIGARQAGRVRGESVIDVPCEARAIAGAIREALERPRFSGMNPFFIPTPQRRTLRLRSAFSTDWL